MVMQFTHIHVVAKLNSIIMSYSGLLDVPRVDSGTQLDPVALGNNGSIIVSVVLADHCIASSANTTEVNDLAAVSDAVVSETALSASVGASTISIFGNQERLFYDKID
ncbi:unnamed protein product [Didymodactylos carnosus]|uniref:Uncharacterized protein n=1 Tax=Didymodactylos carnosus TaxID=1234261 RepID=A0A814UJZ3_9BILA|nr:unnamed protein product [Didymodactylos carnosus]CAF1175438.1 unnamed protein product [Didymodactylos carnosus]CAF3592576.1 unnamed protein product [Didymodactylos carnosus]CAF3939380.1 unnamed protein product [Didymodactylos carnosus]